MDAITVNQINQKFRLFSGDVDNALIVQVYASICQKLQDPAFLKDSRVYLDSECRKYQYEFTFEGEINPNTESDLRGLVEQKGWEFHLIREEASEVSTAGFTITLIGERP